MSNYYYDPNNNRGYIPGRYVNKVILLVLMFFLGSFGIHYFYEGKNLKGILSILFSWTFIPAIITFFRFIATLFKPTNEYGDIFMVVRQILLVRNHRQDFLHAKKRNPGYD